MRERQILYTLLFAVFGYICLLFVKHVNKGNGKEIKKFEVSPKHSSYILESQELKFNVVNETQIDEMFDIFISTKYEYILLEAPTVMKSIRYLQICHYYEDIELQLGIVENEKIVLYSKILELEEAKKVMKNYYHGILDVDMREFQPVQFA